MISRLRGERAKLWRHAPGAPAQTVAMATIEATDDSLVVRLTRPERLMTLHGDIAVPRDSLRRAEVVNHPMSRVRGLRLPGTGFPGLVAMGTYRGQYGKEFYAIWKGQHAVRLLLEGHEFAAIMVGMKEPERLVAEIM